MRGKHIAGGLAAGAFYLNLRGDVSELVLFFGGLALGALIPDIDHTRSMISRKVSIVDNLVSAIFGHRTFTHSLLFLVLSNWLFLQTLWPRSLEMGILIGLASHMLLNALTNKGIQFLWPFHLRVGISGGIRTGGAIEKGFFTFFIVYLCYSAYQIWF